MNHTDLTSNEYGIEIASELTIQVLQLVERLQNNIFVERPRSKSNRQDGEIVIFNSESTGESGMQIRLNAYQYGVRGVVNLEVKDDRVFARTVMVRESYLGKDDRELFAIPHKATIEELPIVENLIFGVCQCVSRGSVRICEENVFDVFLPSDKPMPLIDQNFAIHGIKSLY